MLIKEEDTFEVKKAFLKDMLTSRIPDFDWERYDYNYYNYWDGDFTYNHRVVELLVEDEIVGIKVLLNDERNEDGYWEQPFIVFSYDNEIYRIDYQDGSQGYKYKLDVGTLKSVQPKVKEVIYYE